MIGIVFLLAAFVLFITIAGNRANKGNPENVRITSYFVFIDALLWLWLAYLIYNY